MARHPALTVAVATGVVAAAAAAGWAWLVAARAPVPRLAPVNVGPYDWRREGAQSATTNEGGRDTVVPFKIAVDDEVLQDLSARLARSRTRPVPAAFPDQPAWSYGMDPETLRAMLQHWETGYDWREQEARLNAWPQFTTEIDGLRTHFVHLQADRATADVVRPLLLVHGWPGSFVEFLYVAGPLTQGTAVQPGGPRIAFDVVIPSLPGFAFSEAPGKSGMGPVEIAAHLDKLMQRLGYPRYFYQGGDWGAIIGKALAQLHHDHVLGLHVNMFPSILPGMHPLVALARYATAAVAPAWVLPDPRERAKALPLGRVIGRFVRESGYMHEQATRPDTLGVGLNDSPAGLAAWILEKFYVWSDARDGKLLTQFERDDVLTNVMVYWVSGSITSSLRIYREALGGAGSSEGPMAASAPGGVAVPVGLLCSNVNTLGFESMPRAWTGYLYHDVVQYTDLNEGGHFAALERGSSAAFVRDVQSFAALVLARNPAEISG